MDSNRWGFNNFNSEKIDKLINNMDSNKLEHVQLEEIIILIKEYLRYMRTNCESAAMCHFSVCSSILYHINNSEFERRLIKFCLAPLVMWGLEDVEVIYSWINYYILKNDAYSRPTECGVKWMRETFLLKRDLVHQLVVELNAELPETDINMYLD